MASEKAIEKYQMILMRTPSAKVFAPLSEAYRKMGLLQQAFEVCETGVKHNPEYPSGHVAYGKVLYEMKDFKAAENSFRRAAHLQKDNILTRKLQALCLSKLGRRNDAVTVYKEVLFLSPKDQQAQKYLQNWEYVEAKNFSKKSFPAQATLPEDHLKDASSSQVAAYVEALIARNELDKANDLLLEAQDKWPQDLLLQKQQAVVSEYLDDERRLTIQAQLQVNLSKQKRLKSILHRVEKTSANKTL